MKKLFTLLTILTLPLGVVACGGDEEGGDGQEQALRQMVRAELENDPEMGDVCMGLALFEKDTLTTMLVTQIETEGLKPDEGDSPEEMALVQAVIDDIGTEQMVEIMVDEMDHYCNPSD